MLLAAVAKVIGQRCPIGLVARANLLSRCQKPVTLPQPFEPKADVVLKELLQPAFTSAERFCHSGNCLEGFIVLAGRNDLVYEIVIGIWLGLFHSNQFQELMNGRLIVKCQ